MHGQMSNSSIPYRSVSVLHAVHSLQSTTRSSRPAGTIAIAIALEVRCGAVRCITEVEVQVAVEVDRVANSAFAFPTRFFYFKVEKQKSTNDDRRPTSYSTLFYSVLLYSTLLYSYYMRSLLYCTMFQSTSIILYSTLLNSILFYCIVLQLSGMVWYGLWCSRGASSAPGASSTHGAHPRSRKRSRRWKNAPPAPAPAP